MARSDDAAALEQETALETLLVVQDRLLQLSLYDVSNRNVVY